MQDIKGRWQVTMSGRARCVLGMTGGSYAPLVLIGISEQWSFDSSNHSANMTQTRIRQAASLKCLLMALVISNISSLLLPKIGCNLSSAMISRLFAGF
jgi:hypothetical protein